MNKRQKAKRYKIGSTAKQRRRNKELCKRYPFLIPRNCWSDKISWDTYKDTKKYSYTLADDFPKGWWKAFGLMLCEELRQDLIKCNYLYQFRLAEIKEKYGGLRIYPGPIPDTSNAWEIIENYSIVSENICIRCGRPDVHMINNNGWISPYCLDCYKYIVRNSEKYYKSKKGFNQLTYKEIEEQYKKSICNGDDGKMADVRKYIRFSKDGTQTFEIDVSCIANRIREAWRGRKY